MRTVTICIRVSCLVVVILSIALNLTNAFGATISVPTVQYPTIQAGIDAAVNGDTVLVADGTYTGEGNKNLDFNGKAITVVSENGPNSTIIDCEGEGRGFWFHTGEGENSVLSGFTVTNGQSNYGGGIACFNASPTITNCIITENDAKIVGAFDGLGGGIYCDASAPIIRNSIISKNSASQYGGGIAVENGSSPNITDSTIIENSTSIGGMGVYSRDGTLSLTNCTIQDNFSSSTAGSGGGIYGIDSDIVMANCVISGHRVGEGGGIHCSGGSLEISDSTISENEGTNIPNYGGGVSCSGADVNITGSTISHNTAGGGGGIYCFNSTIDISQCIITENRSTKYLSNGYGGGGGIFCPNSTGSITNCLITRNTAAFGGGISSDGNAPNITNCTISQNTATGDSLGNNDSSGGIYIRNSSPSITNCIFWENSSGEILVVSGSPTVKYSTVQNGWPGVGNISSDPEFVDLINDDYHLADYSSCIGTGTSGGAPAFDIEGNPRPDPSGSNPDMGAYENGRGTQDIPPLDIFGLRVGNEWTYQGTNPGGSYSSEAEDVLIDQTTFPVTTHVIEYTVGGTLAGKDWYETTSSELKLWGEDYGDFYKFSSGLILAWYPMQVGEQRYSSATVLVEGLFFNISMTVKVLIKEPIDLGFDTLEAYKLRYKIRIWGHGVDISDTTYRWGVPYLGFVKFQDGESIEVLTDFAIGGGMITPTTDADEDGLKDYEELIIYETNLKNSDTDGDGLSDGEEVNTHKTDPNDSDSDDDGLTDFEEINTYNTDPNNEDTDNDGLSDFEEINTYNTDPNNEDTDGDELSDGDEIAIGTDPNNPDTDGDGMPDGWEDDHDLDPLVDDAAGDPDGDGYSNLEEYNLGRHPTNVEPDTPLLYLPTDTEIMVSLTPQLQTQSFSDTDGDFHAQSQWQIGKPAGNPESCSEESFTNSDYAVFDGTSDTELTLFDVPDLLLEVGANYCWRARFTDTGRATSEWADPFSFSTIAQSEDDTDPQNGIPDSQEADCLGIFDPGGIPQDTLCVDTLVGNAQVGIEPSTNVVSIDAFKSVDPQTIPENLKGVELLIGLMSFKVEVDQVGDIIEITFHSSEPMPEAAKCYKYDPVNGWQDYSAHVVSISLDRKSITLEYKDGDFGDLDGVANKFVIDPVGFGVAATGGGGGGGGGSGGGGGGGCFISTTATGFSKSSEVLALVLLFSFFVYRFLRLQKNA